MNVKKLVEELYDRRHVGMTEDELALLSALEKAIAADEV